MHFLSLIEAKREGHPLAPEQIREMIAACTRGDIPDYQLAAFLMAVYFQGLDPAETSALTLAMRDSGDVLKFPRDPRPLVDKHSTGGVGDKVSLPLTPLLACLGFRVPMISGRGLGITGGTLDKLESIPGFRTALPAEHIIAIVQRVGCVICGQTEFMVPADKILYALRDVTGTVPSIPLIVASILSKKLAEGLAALVLDVKFGRAAFMPTLEQARALAQAMVRLGNRCGVRTRALLTSMDTPLGSAAGNWLEVKESVQCLEGRGPADLRELVIDCASHLLLLTGKATTFPAARREVNACLASLKPLQKWEEMLAAQGANLPEYHRKLALDCAAPVITEVIAPEAGYVTRCDALVIGEIIRDLGGGRLTRTSAVNPEVGVDRLMKPGAQVSAGAVLARLHAPDRRQAEVAGARLATVFQISRQAPRSKPLIRAILAR